MVKKSENLKNLENSLKTTFFIFFFVCRKKEKKCYPLSFTILGGHDLTRALQSSPFQNPGGNPERDGGGGRGGQTNQPRKSLCLISTFKWYRVVFQ